MNEWSETEAHRKVMRKDEPTGPGPGRAGQGQEEADPAPGLVPAAVRPERGKEKRGHKGKAVVVAAHAPQAAGAKPVVHGKHPVPPEFAKKPPIPVGKDKK